MLQPLMSLYDIASVWEITRFLFSSYLALCFVGIVTGLLAFYWLKDKTYLYFTFYLFSVMNLSVFGKLILSYDYIHQFSLYESIQAVGFPMVANIAMYFFIRSIFQHNRENNKLFSLFKYTVFAATVADLIGIFIVTKLTYNIRGFALIVSVIASLVLLSKEIKKLSYLRWYFLGIIVFIVCSLPFILISAGVTAEVNPTIVSIPYIGASIQILLFIIGILDRLRYEYEERLQESRVRLLGTTAAEIFHEIATPISLIMYQTEKLTELSVNTNELSLKEKLEKSANKLRDGCDRILANIDRFRSLSNYKENVRITSIIPIKDLLKNIEDLTKLRLKKRMQTLDIEHNCANELFIEGNKFEIEQILLNLIFNASDATQNNLEKWIKVKVTCHDQKIEIQVIDSGNGIPLEIQKLIFNPFFTTKSSKDGTGLGLSICRKFAQNNGGDLVLNTSHPNTCFVLTLPLKYR